MGDFEAPNPGIGFGDRKYHDEMHRNDMRSDNMHTDNIYPGDMYPIATEPLGKAHVHCGNCMHCNCCSHRRGGFLGLDMDDIILIGVIIILLMQKEECDWGSLAGAAHLLMH